MVREARRAAEAPPPWMHPELQAMAHDPELCQMHHDLEVILRNPSPPLSLCF